MEEEVTHEQPAAKKGGRSFRFWVIALLAVIALAVAWPYVSDLIAESSCTADDGRVMVHNLSGRRLCDKPPFTDGIGGMGSNDYWID